MRKYIDDESICVFVANLPSVLNDLELSDRLYQVLGGFGKIVNVKASRDGRGRPFAFVQFEGKVVDFLLTETVTIEDRVLRFERAKSTFNAHQPPAQLHPLQPPSGPVHFFPQFAAPVYPGFAPAPVPTSFVPEESDDACSSSTDSSSTNSPAPFKVFVGRLNGDLITQRKLLRRFQRHGHITDIELFKRNLDGTPRKEAFAFVSYLTEEQLFTAIREENDKEWLGGRIKCCKALPKREHGSNAMAYEPASTTEGTFYYPPPAAVFYPPPGTYHPGPFY